MTGTRVHAQDVGAIGDGATDDGPALQRALDALSPGDVLELEAGRVYRHDDVLRVRRQGTGLTGAATLLATDEERSALLVEADRVTVDGGLVLETASTSKRWSGVAQHGLSVVGASGVVLRDVRVAGSAASGVFLTGAEDFVVEWVTVEDTRADGVHMTGGSARGLVQDVVSRRTGDDGVAVVSYDGDQAVTEDVTVVRPVVSGMRGGRGVSVVGGERVLLCDVKVTDSWAAAIYVASEGAPYFTRGVRHVTVAGADLLRSNQSPSIDHGAVLVYNGRDSVVVEDVRIRDVDVVETRRTASRQVGLLDTTGPLRDVVLEDVRVSGGGDHPFQSTTSPEAYRLSGWTVDGQRRPDIGG